MRGLSRCFLVVFAIAGCGVKKDVYEQELARNRALLAEKQSLEEKLRAAEDKAEGDAKRLADLQVQLSLLGQDLSKSKEGSAAVLTELEVARKRAAEAAERIAQFRVLVARFQRMINDGKLEVQVRNGRMLVKLRDDILFDPGKVDVKPAGRDALAEVARILKDVPDRDFQVAGHTDNVPLKGHRYRSNWQLSTERALQVARILREAGMPPNHLSAAGYADTVPVGDNGTDDGRRKNRRIEIVLEPNINELPNLGNIGTSGG